MLWVDASFSEVVSLGLITCTNVKQVTWPALHLGVCELAWNTQSLEKLVNIGEVYASRAEPYMAPWYNARPRGLPSITLRSGALDGH